MESQEQTDLFHSNKLQTHSIAEWEVKPLKGPTRGELAAAQNQGVMSARRGENREGSQHNPSWQRHPEGKESWGGAFSTTQGKGKGELWRTSSGRRQHGPPSQELGHSSQWCSLILPLPLVRPGATGERTRGLRPAPHPGTSNDQAEERHSSQADLAPIRIPGFSIPSVV